MPALPKSNRGALIGALLASVLVGIAERFAEFLATGQPLPGTGEGWLRLLFPMAVAAVAAARTPYLSLTEWRRGYRVATIPPDAPVLLRKAGESPGPPH